MNLDRIPLVRRVVETGADNRVFDSLLVAGPVVVVLVAVVGRNPVTLGIAAGYIAVFLGNVILNAVRPGD